MGHARLIWCSKGKGRACTSNLLWGINCPQLIVLNIKNKHLHSLNDNTMVLCTPHSKLWKYNSLVACEAYTIVLVPLVIQITLSKDHTSL